jgi:hypothetical protein
MSGTILLHALVMNPPGPRAVLALTTRRQAPQPLKLLPLSLRPRAGHETLWACGQARRACAGAGDGVAAVLRSATRRRRGPCAAPCGLMMAAAGLECPAPRGRTTQQRAQGGPGPVGCAGPRFPPPGGAPVRLRAPLASGGSGWSVKRPFTRCCRPQPQPAQPRGGGPGGPGALPCKQAGREPLAVPHNFGPRPGSAAGSAVTASSPLLPHVSVPLPAQRPHPRGLARHADAWGANPRIQTARPLP